MRRGNINKQRFGGQNCDWNSEVHFGFQGGPSITSRVDRHRINSATLIGLFRDKPDQFSFCGTPPKLK